MTAILCGSVPPRWKTHLNGMHLRQEPDIPVPPEHDPAEPIKEPPGTPEVNPPGPVEEPEPSAPRRL